MTEAALQPLRGARHRCLRLHPELWLCFYCLKFIGIYLKAQAISKHSTLINVGCRSLSRKLGGKGFAAGFLVMGMVF